MPNYFLVSLSNRTNLDLCIKHALAGFTNSANGFWTYLEISEGDYLSFLYGARAWNLYKVTSKSALKGAEELPPWPSVTFRASGRTYYFPFRLHLEPVRALRESLVRSEFAYVAENLLLRGGYRKTHFQADQTTLQSASQMGEPYPHEVEHLQVNSIRYEPLIGFTQAAANPPDVYQFSELILQALLKKHLSSERVMPDFLSAIGLDSLASQPVEVLGELALPEGQVDTLIKEATPIGLSRKVAVEVKLRSASIADVDQLDNYVRTLGAECQAGVLVSEKASRRAVSYARDKGLHIFLYRLSLPIGSSPVSFDELLTRFRLHHS